MHTTSTPLEFIIMNSWRITPKPYTRVKMSSSSIAISQLLSEEKALTFFIQPKDLYVQGLKNMLKAPGKSTLVRK